MNGLPDRVLLRRSEILLAGLGITKRDLKKALATGRLVKVVLPGCVYGKYRRDDVVQAFDLQKGVS